MFCPNCGFQNEDGARFCNECGAPLTPQAAPEEPPAEVENVIPEETPEISEAPAAQETAPEAPVPEEPIVPEAPVPEEPIIPEAPVPEEPTAPDMPAAPEEPPVFPQEPFDRRPEMNTPPAGEYVPPFAPVPPVGPDRANVPPMQPQFMAPPAPAGVHPVIAAMKKVFSSPLFIAAFFAQLASVILNFIAAISPRATILFRSDTYDARLSVGGSSLGSAIVSMIISLLTPLALLLILIPAMNKKESRFSTSGFTFLKVLAVIGIVLICIAGAAVIAFYGMMIAIGKGAVVESFDSFINDPEFLAETKGFMNRFGSIGTAALIVSLVIIVAVFVFFIVYLAKYIKTLNTYKKVAATSVPSDRVSPFFAVVMIICGVCSTALAVFLAVYGLFVAGAAYLLGAVSMICFGLTVFRFRNEMRALKASMPAQPYVPQGYAPQGYAPAPQQGYAPQGFAPQYAPVVCPRCGGTFAPELAFCPHCGLPR